MFLAETSSYSPSNSSSVVKISTAKLVSFLWGDHCRPTGKVIPNDGSFIGVAIATGENKLSWLESMAFLLASSAVVKAPTEHDGEEEVKVSCDPPLKIVIDGEMLEMNPITFI
jgi:diacylglycerol kinase family enzyme